MRDLLAPPMRRPPSSDATRVVRTPAKMRQARASGEEEEEEEGPNGKSLDLDAAVRPYARQSSKRETSSPPSSSSSSSSSSPSSAPERKL